MNNSQLKTILVVSGIAGLGYLALSSTAQPQQVGGGGSAGGGSFVIVPEGNISASNPPINYNLGDLFGADAVDTKKDITSSGNVSASSSTPTSFNPTNSTAQTESGGISIRASDVPVGTALTTGGFLGYNSAGNKVSFTSKKDAEASIIVAPKGGNPLNQTVSTTPTNFSSSVGITSSLGGLSPTSTAQKSSGSSIGQIVAQTVMTPVVIVSSVVNKISSWFSGGKK